ncbi:hypothetical protein EVAR_12073_1 [Eumeta japonica]|uniref:Uncharacterized protein n=1 Tax=Eumeta variegata TaxID=151549 RepID=A0A4C1U545_EUMVA|nr:hypothetical protein EVAR_12073_1 [Eumeta japonica]
MSINLPIDPNPALNLDFNPSAAPASGFDNAIDSDLDPVLGFTFRYVFYFDSTTDVASRQGDFFTAALVVELLHKNNKSKHDIHFNSLLKSYVSACMRRVVGHRIRVDYDVIRTTIYHARMVLKESDQLHSLSDILHPKIPTRFPNDDDSNDLLRLRRVD